VARAHLAQGITLYGTRQPQAYGLTIGQDPGTACFILTSLVLWLLGYPEQAMQQAQKALSLAQALSHPFSLAFALDQVAVIHLLRGEWLAVQERAQAIITIAATQGFALWMAHATLLQGRALVAQGQIASGLAQMHQGVAAMHATGQMQGKVMTLSLLAEAYALNGEIEVGLDTLAEALEIIHTHGLRLWEAEVYRLRGEFLLARHGTGQKLTDQHAEAVAACFQQALEVARQQQVRAWELRTALSLSRLWQRQGRALAARQLLADIYGWFTEGFDTADLRAARTVVDQYP
jgi:predicted ATPase